ncbi:histone acetyltransferase HAC12 isoform X3 [Citrus sinensis]|uniref:histone acetyltransferase HAC12 isoform X3 n=2 Tax=Citrus sinensis TaxID=2711 RepID=UPI002278FDAA|nr:histone acetyltransferase HAC12 isoform X3 [Citrus sinensis]
MIALEYLKHGEIYEPGLNCCLQTLIQNKMDDVCPIQQVAYHATSSSLPCHMSMSTLDFRRDSYSDGLVPPFSLLNGSTEGLTFDGYLCGAPSVLTAVNRKNIPSPMAKKQIPHFLQIIPEVPSTLPSTDLEYQWPYVQFDEPSDGKAQFYFNKRDVSCSLIAEQNMCMQTASPSEPLYVSPLASESNAPTSNQMGAAKYAKPSNPSCLYLENRILHAYINYKSSMVANGGSIVSFVNYLHSTICNIHWCGCERFCILLSHFDGCHSAECHICGPVRYASDAANHQKFDIMKSSFSDTDCDWSKSGSSNCLFPSSKRLKMEHPICPFSSGVGISSFVDPLQVQSFDFGAVPPLQQLPESPKSINSEVRELDMELLRNPAKDSTIFEGTRNSIVDHYCMLNSQKVFTPEEFNFGSKMEEDLSSGGDIADIFLDSNRLSNRLRSSVVSVDEACGAGCKEDEVLVRAKLNETNPEIKSECVAVPVRTESDLTKPGTKNELIAQEADNGQPLKLRNPRTNGVSLTDFFTAEQLRAHISNLRQLVSQSALKEEKGNKTTNTLSDNSCQLCQAEKLLLAPTPIYCSYCGADIKRYVIYYSTPEENGMRHCFCKSCYKQSRGGKISLYGISFSKAKMYKRKNDEDIEEAWVLCDKCQGWQHQICALYNNKRDTEGKAEYICPKCRLKEIETGDHLLLAESTFFAAKDLPSTMLSDHLEQRLFTRIQEERKMKANVSGKNLDEVPTAEDLVVRVVLSVDKKLKVKQQFLDIFHEANYPTEFPYRLKVILLFQKIEGVDVCLFGMYVQEFGSECSHPNQRCVYISYLDSVKYFRPETETAAGKTLRTFVYHEILIGYLEYSKKRGFATCYIWACPPVKGEDYILYCHPEMQKTPKSDKLRQWYRSMLRKAAEEKIVVGISNLYDQFFIPTGQHSKVTAARLPYFDGDYWSGAAEGVIKSIEQERGDDFHKKLKKPMTKRMLKAMGHADPSSNAAKDILFMQKLGQIIFPVKEDFIVVHLQFVCSHCHEVILYRHRWFCSQCKYFQLCERCHDAERNLNGEDIHTLNGKEKHALSKVMVDDVPCHTRDKDVITDNTLFENRNAFLSFCQKNYYQFDTLRRAKFSSMMILHHLHNSSMLTAESICCLCRKDTVIDQCWQCETCPQFEVCTACYQEKGNSLHIHKLTQRSSAVDGGTESREAQTKALQAGRNPDTYIHSQVNLTLQKTQLMNLLQHASQCSLTKSKGCSYPKCLQMKTLFYHARSCNVRTAGGCQHCRKIWLLLTMHSRRCKELDCRVPRCKDLKQWNAEAVVGCWKRGDSPNCKDRAGLAQSSSHRRTW